MQRSFCNYLTRPYIKGFFCTSICFWKFEFRGLLHIDLRWTFMILTNLEVAWHTCRSAYFRFVRQKDVVWQIKANQIITISLNATPKVYLSVSVNIFLSVCAGRWHVWTTHLKATEVSRYVDGEQLRCGESCSLFSNFLCWTKMYVLLLMRFWRLKISVWDENFH
jgi:hypothetical protein